MADGLLVRSCAAFEPHPGRKIDGGDARSPPRSFYSSSSRPEKRPRSIYFFREDKSVCRRVPYVEDLGKCFPISRACNRWPGVPSIPKGVLENCATSRLAFVFPTWALSFSRIVSRKAARTTAVLDSAKIQDMGRRDATTRRRGERARLAKERSPAINHKDDYVKIRRLISSRNIARPSSLFPCPLATPSNSSSRTIPKAV